MLPAQTGTFCRVSLSLDINILASVNDYIYGVLWNIYWICIKYSTNILTDINNIIFTCIFTYKCVSIITLTSLAITKSAMILIKVYPKFLILLLPLFLLFVPISRKEYVDITLVRTSSCSLARDSKSYVPIIQAPASGEYIL